MCGGGSRDVEVAVEKLDNIIQEGKHDAVAHDPNEDVSTFDPLVVIRVNIAFEYIDLSHDGFGGAMHHHPKGNITQKEEEGRSKASAYYGSTGNAPTQIDEGIPGIRTEGLKDTNFFAYYATIDNNNNGTEDGKDRELTTALALEKIEGFSVYVPLEQTIHKYGAKEYAISRK